MAFFAGVVCFVEVTDFFVNANNEVEVARVELGKE